MGMLKKNLQGYLRILLQMSIIRPFDGFIMILTN